MSPDGKPGFPERGIWPGLRSHSCVGIINLSPGDGHGDPRRVLLTVNLSVPAARAPDSESIKVRLSASLKSVNCTCNLFPSKCGRLPLSASRASGEVSLQSRLGSNPI